MSRYDKKTTWGFGLNGEPLTAEEAEALLEDIDKRRIALDLTPYYAISTVHLVVDHSMARGMFRYPNENKHVPVLYETMIFTRKHWDHEDEEECSCSDDFFYCERYKTKALAVIGHAAALTYAKNNDALMCEFGSIIRLAMAQALIK
jgi:hypothetical protein